MPRAFGNAIAEIVSAPGTGAFDLGAAAAGCKLFSTATLPDGTAVGTGDTFKCASFAIDAAGNPSGGREIGIYTFTSGSPNTLTRTTIIESSNGGAAVNFTDNVRVELIPEVAADVAAPEFPVFAGASLPAAPAEGFRLFAQRRGGRDSAAVRGSSGDVRTLMEQFGTAGIRAAFATYNGTGLATLGLTIAVAGTATARAIGAASMFATGGRCGAVSSGGAGSSAGFRSAGSHCLRGASAGVGGFHIITRFGTAAFTSTGRLFCGVLPVGAMSNADPGTLANIFGIGCDSADSNLQLFTNDSAGLPVKTDLGASFPCKTANTDLYDFRFGCAPNTNNIGWSLERLNTGDFTSGVVSSDLPDQTQLLSWQLWINSGTTASAVAVDIYSVSIHTPT